MFTYYITHLKSHGSITLKDPFMGNLLEKQKDSGSFRDG